MRSSPVTLGMNARQLVEATLEEVALHRGWLLLAANARTNHVHSVVEADATPERVMGDFKSWCTRRLTEAGETLPGASVWSRHGSTRYLWCPAAVELACDYVLRRQESDVD